MQSTILQARQLKNQQITKLAHQKHMQITK